MTTLGRHRGGQHAHLDHGHSRSSRTGGERQSVPSVHWATLPLSLLLTGSAIAGAAGLIIPIFGLVPAAVATVLVVLGLLSVARLRLPLWVGLPTVLFVSLAFLATVISLFTTGNFEYSVRGIVGLLVFVGAMLATASVCSTGWTAVDDRRRSILLTVIAILTVATSLWALRQSLLGFTGAEISAIHNQISTFAVGDEIRSSGLFSGNQDFGAYAACATPALVVLAMNARNRRWLFTIAAVLLGTALVISLTRTAIVAALVSSLVALVLYSPARAAAVRAVVGITTAGLVGALAYWVLSTSENSRSRAALERINTMFDVQNDIAFNARLDYVWLRGVELLRDNPFGLGAGSAGPVSSTLPDIAPAGSVTTDQGYLMVGVQMGWFGMAVFVWMLLALLIWLGKSSDASARAGAMAVLALLVAMMASQYWALSAPITLLGALVGVGLSARASQDQLPRQSRLPEPVPGQHPTGSFKGR